jgi:hypothetical protein
MSKRRIEIIPECYVDTTLISILLGSDVNHKKGCPSVAMEMQGGRSANSFAVGIVDNDKRKLNYFEQFTLIVENPLLHLFRHPKKPQFLIKIGGEAEAMESFILACADAAGIDLSQYGLKPDLESLKAKTKSTTSMDDPQLKSLFRDLSKTGEVARLKSILKYLDEKRYQSSDEELKKMF